MKYHLVNEFSYPQKVSLYYQGNPVFRTSIPGRQTYSFTHFGDPKALELAFQNSEGIRFPLEYYLGGYNQISLSTMRGSQCVGCSSL